jgi:hypothetical protein
VEADHPKLKLKAIAPIAELTKANVNWFSNL